MGALAFVVGPITAGIFLQGDVLPFIVTTLSRCPLWMVALSGWLVPGTIVNLGVVGWLVGRRRRRLGGRCVLAATILSPIASFLLFSCFPKYQFLAPSSFKEAGRTLVSLAWRGGFVAGVLAPAVCFLAVAGCGWLRLRWRGQHVAFRDVPNQWRPGTGRFVALSIVGSSLVALALAMTIQASATTADVLAGLTGTRR